ncbi:MAG: phage major tail tube protein [Salinisphaera sp.]|jgi:P2 family phage contractile tail tube protein|nr:phage major tail tube protein [Salinisphaera sp.]
MAANDVLKNLNLFVDGRGYAGNIDDYSPPDLSIMVENYRAGGMDASVPLDMGMEDLETSFNLIAYDRDVLSLFGVAEGNQVPFRARGALESYDGTITQVQHIMRGKITKLARNTWQPGNKPQLGVTMRLDYYREEHGGQVIHEIDVVNMIRIINGTDRLAQIRQAIGI